jgi:hypothetical protein
MRQCYHPQFVRGLKATIVWNIADLDAQDQFSDRAITSGWRCVRDWVEKVWFEDSDNKLPGYKLF